MPKAFSKQENDLIAKRLLDQGYRLFSAYGLKKTNIEELAQAAGISKGAFYNFYESKEALFIDVIEQAEIRVRSELLAVIDLPGKTPRIRLVAVLNQAFNLFKTIPILQFFTGTDFDLLFRRVPAEKLQEHLTSDQAFFDELVARCQQAGIPIRARTVEISGLLYQLVLAMMHQDNLGQISFSSSFDVLLELVAAYCLGEVEIPSQKPVIPAPQLKKGDNDEPGN